MRDMQEEIERLTDELKRLQEIGELEKQTNAQLEIQISELKEKLSGKKVEMELEMGLEIAELNKRIKELQMELRETELKYKKKIDESTAENGKIHTFKQHCFMLTLTNLNFRNTQRNSREGKKQSEEV